ncbi:MAG: 4Fe-4S dicluster domain-containing protein [Elusimicrobiales bacterium]
MFSQGQAAGTSLLAVVDGPKCAACGACVGACPVGAISMKDIAVIAAAKCTGCGACVDVCAPGAITLKPR